MKQRHTMNTSITDSRNELKTSSLQGAPIIFAGCIYFAFLFLISFFASQDILALIWVIGLGTIFPLGMIISQLLGARLFIKDNQLGVLAGSVGGIQALFLPTYIIIYKFAPEWLPLIIGTLTAAHFIPYIWIYQSKIYAMMIFFMTILSVVLGCVHSITYTAVPLGLAMTYAVFATFLYTSSKK